MASSMVFPLDKQQAESGRCCSTRGPAHQIWLIPGHRMSSTVGGGDVDGQGSSGLLDHLQHLQLRLQLQAVAALTLHQGGSCPLHPNQPATQGGQEVGG